MSRLPLRLKLTLVFAVAMALVLSGAGLFVHHSPPTSHAR